MATDIFAMLRDRRAAEALPIARQLRADAPDNTWNLRALMRALCGVIWECKDAAQMQQYAEELRGLPPLPPGEADAWLVASREKALLRADPLNQELWEIRALSRSGAHKDALDRLRQIHRAHPDRHDVDEALAWELWQGNMEELRAETPDKGRIRNLFCEYHGLKTKKPSVVHSRMLDVAARAAHKGAFPTFCAFLKWWEPANLREEDFNASAAPDGKTFPSVVEHVIQGLGKALKGETNPELVADAGTFIEQHYQRYPEQEKWFPYYLGRAWIKIGRNEEAKALLLPVVRRNQTQSWAWSQLASCFQETEPECAACICRALLCPHQEAQFLVGIRLKLAAICAARGMVGEAKREVDEVVRVRQEQGWSVTDEIVEMTRSDWYRDATAKDGTGQFRQWALEAAKVLTSGLPWHDAVLGLRDVAVPESNDRLAVVDARDEHGSIVSLSVKMKAFEMLGKVPAGTCLAVQMDGPVGNPLVVGARERNGTPWDIIPKVLGLVVRVSPETRKTMVLAEDGTEFLCYHADLPASRTLSPGTFVQCVAIRDPRLVRVRHVEAHRGAVASSHWKEYSGSFRPRADGAGHAGEVFVHVRLANGFGAGTMVRGIAVRRTNEQTRSSWWDAVTALSDDAF